MKFNRKIILSFFCCCLCVTLTARTSLVDSLEQILSSGKLNHPEKAELLNNLSHAYIQVDLEKSRIYAFEAYHIAKDGGLKKAEAEACIEIANTYSSVDSELNREYALEYAMKALQLAQDHNLKGVEARAYFALGNYYSLIMLPFQAHAHYIKAEKIFLELDDKDRLYLIDVNLMILYNNLKDSDNEIYYAKKVLKMATERKDWKWTLTAKLILADTRFRDNPNQEALDYFMSLHQQILHIEDSLGLRHGLSITVGWHCIKVFCDMKRYHEVLPYLYRMYQLYQTDDYMVHLGITYIYLAQIHTVLHNIDSAEYYLNKAENLRLNVQQKTVAFYASAKIDSIKGDYLNALANYQKFHHISDSLSKEEKTTEMARLKLWHEFTRKELEKIYLQQEYQKQRKLTLTLTIMLVMTLALFAIAIFFYRKIREKKREMEDKNHEMEKMNTVKNKLFSVVAHDLRSPVFALTAVLKLTQKNEFDAETQVRLLKDISKRFDDVSGLIDNLLRWAKSQMQGIVMSPVYFDVQNEIRTVLENLQDIAVDKMITMNNRTEKREVYADRDMFSVVVRNLAMNALKYTPPGGELTIDSELSGNLLVVSVKDTGTGMSQEVQEKLFKLSETKSRRGTKNESGTGLGLVLCADFVKANGGSIWFTSEPNKGSTFFFSVPVKNGNVLDDVN